MSYDWLEIKDTVVFEQDIKKSRFIAYAYPVTSEEEAKEYIKALRKEHPKAVHACSAMIIDDIERSNDDGEPASSAGMPILSVLRGHSLNHVLCVVIRYFGGTLLGVGGLIQAYTSSAQGALAQAIFKRPVETSHYRVTFPYTMINPVEQALTKIATITDRHYDGDVSYEFHTTTEQISDLLTEATNGQTHTQHIDTFLVMEEITI